MKQANKTMYRILISTFIGFGLAVTPVWVSGSTQVQKETPEQQEAEINLTDVKLPNPIFLFLNGMR